jgi:exopolysaccharide biosynthesis polyprenyl glycosylphosphotransferase
MAISVALSVGVLALGGAHLAPATALVPPIFVLLAKVVGLYDRDERLLHRSAIDEVAALFGLATLTTLLVWLFESALVVGSLDRRQVIAIWAILLLALVAFRLAARAAARQLSPAERCVVVGDSTGVRQLRQRLPRIPSVNAHVVGWIPLDDTPARTGPLPDQLRALVAESRVDRVVLAAPSGSPEELLDSIFRVAGHSVRVSVLSDVSRIVDASELDRVGGLTLLGLRSSPLGASARFAKRAFDVIGATAALFVLAPVVAVIGALIRLDSRGPVIFYQRRVGREGRVFPMLKFRTMVADAETLRHGLLHLNEGDGVFKIANDPRITRVGRFLRRTYADELPQLVNVLRGEMSLVGPRPLPLDEDARLTGWQRRRLELRPGITGIWQVSGSSRVPTREMARLDYHYVAGWSLRTDIRILLLTIPWVVRRRGL